MHKAASESAASVQSAPETGSGLSAKAVAIVAVPALVCGVVLAWPAVSVGMVGSTITIAIAELIEYLLYSSNRREKQQASL